LRHAATFEGERDENGERESGQQDYRSSVSHRSCGSQPGAEFELESMFIETTKMVCRAGEKKQGARLQAAPVSCYCAV